MKKAIILICLVFIGLQANAEELYNFEETLFYYPEMSESQKLDVVRTKTSCNSDVYYGEKYVTFMGSESSILRNDADTKDPYKISVNGKTYIMIKDNGDNVWDPKDILGINDPVENRFLSLINIPKKNESQLTADDMRRSNIRFVLFENNTLLVSDKTKDFDLNYIDYIDMNELIHVSNAGNDGIFGQFFVYLKNCSKKFIFGVITFDDTDNWLFE